MIFTLFPFYWMAVTSLKPNSELYNRKIMPLIVYHPTLKHYVDLLTETNFLVWTWNTLLVADWSPRRSRWCSASCWPIRWRACGSPAPH